MKTCYYHYCYIYIYITLSSVSTGDSQLERARQNESGERGTARNRNLRYREKMSDLSRCYLDATHSCLCCTSAPTPRANNHRLMPSFIAHFKSRASVRCTAHRRHLELCLFRCAKNQRQMSRLDRSLCHPPRQTCACQHILRTDSRVSSDGRAIEQ